MSNSIHPFALSILPFSIQTFFLISQAQVSASNTFKYVNEGEFEEYISGNPDYRSIPIATSPFQLRFYNTTYNAYTLALRMGTSRSESLRRWVWEANRGNPVRDNATFSLGTDGNLVLADYDGRVVWQTNTANKGVVGFELLPNDKLNGYICKKKEKELRALIFEGRTWRVINADQFVFEVISDESHLVDLRTRTCTCKDWQLLVFSCAHTVACVNSLRTLRLEYYIEHYWFLKSYRKSYEKTIRPIPSAVKEQYMYKNDIEINTPLTKRSPEIPKKNRFKTKGERENVNFIRCSCCKTLGHHNNKKLHRSD